MTKRKRKTVHPPLKRKKQGHSRDLAEMENLLKQRINPVKNAKAKTIKRTYQAETLGLPPLKMVLVHAQNERLNASAKPIIKNKSKTTRTQEELVMKLIEHLTKSQ